jgi:ketosteroid isomerase-like protein
MTDDGTQIRTLIERWANAVHAGDMNGVLADHSADIVMFDVPPPNNGVRGIEAYRATWPPFFEWQRRGAMFEIVSLDVIAGRRRRVCVCPTSLRNRRGTRAGS